MAGPVKEFEVHPYVQFMMDKYSPYKRWIESEGVPIIGGAFVQDVRTQKLESLGTQRLFGRDLHFLRPDGGGRLHRRDRSGQEYQTSAPALRRDHHRRHRARRDNRLVRQYGQAHVRMGARQYLCHSLQRLAPALSTPAARSLAAILR